MTTDQLFEFVYILIKKKESDRISNVKAFWNFAENNLQMG